MARAPLAPWLLKAVPMRLVRLILIAGLLGLSTPAGAESPPTTIVQNDGFFFGDPIGTPLGLAAGDVVAARFTAAGGASALIEVMVVVGGGTGSEQLPITLKVWDDTAQTDEPGAELFSSQEFLSSTTTPTLQFISLAGVGVPSRFRVGIVLGADAPPTVAHDTDGTIAADNNFTFHPATGWRKSQADGIPGDWIIRANLVGGGGGGGGGGGVGACFGATCPAGQFCDDTIRACTFECRTEDDCGGAFCNGNGQCVGEGGVGCCQTGGGAGRAASVLALAVLALVLRRRRR